MFFNLCQISIVSEFLDGKNIGDITIRVSDSLILYIIGFALCGMYLIRLADILKKKEEQDKEIRISAGNVHKRTIKFPRNTTFVIEEQENNNK